MESINKVVSRKELEWLVCEVAESLICNANDTIFKEHAVPATRIDFWGLCTELGNAPAYERIPEESRDEADRLIRAYIIDYLSGGSGGAGQLAGPLPKACKR